MFSQATQTWFEQTFAQPTEVQQRGWESIERGSHSLLVAPTGSGKTLAAFLAAIDQLTQLPEDAVPGVRVLYVSPLKALVYDVERNLRAPLMGIQRTAERLGINLRPVQVAVRTGDTPADERRRMAKHPAEILVTTPESLYLMLGSQVRSTLATVSTVIVDEVHAVAPSKRGAHLALSLERLAELTEADPQRVGLSATVRPLDEIGRFLVGGRTFEIVDASAPPVLDVEVRVPVPNMEDISSGERESKSPSVLGQLYARDAGAATQQRGIWAEIYPELLEQIRACRSTIIFVNSRGLCERLAQRLNEVAEEELVRAHHGSVSHEKRAEIEEGLKSGEIRAIVATSSLELGIDMGAVDRVLLVESPGSVARGLQRVGRAGHQVGAVSVGRVYPKFRGDLLESAVVASRMLEGKIEALRVPRNPLDVCAQQIVAMCCDRPRSPAELETLVRRAYPFAELSDAMLEALLDMLTGRFPSADFADLRPLLSWDRAADLLSPRRGTAMTARMNAGTIPDRGNYGVFLAGEGPRVGELDEEMVFETQTGDVILLGASSWRVEEITRDRVVVSPAPGEPGRLPFWRGDGPGRPLELGEAMGEFVAEVGRRKRADAIAWLIEETPLDDYAAENLADYVLEQKEHCDGVLPTHKCIVLERFRDELGDWRVCILTPFGTPVHAPWAMALQRQLSERSGFEVQVMYTDDGIVLRFADTGELPDFDLLLPSAEEVDDLITDQLSDTALFAGLFRENAVRSLLLPRRRPTQRSPLWVQRLKSQSLLATVRSYANFPMVLETYRQALRDVFDLEAFKSLLRRVQSREVQVHEIETPSASPFARSLVFAYVAAYIYEQDAPVAERRAQALTLDRNLLQELLGQAELRELLDAEVLAELEESLQRLRADQRLRDPDDVHDLLRRLGDLTLEEVALRSLQDPAPWLEDLRTQRRVTSVEIDGEPRFIAAEDSGWYRDALGTQPEPGLPATFLDSVTEPLVQLLRRFARCRGPFHIGEAAGRYGLRRSQVEPALRQLEQLGTVVFGEIRPGGTELDWCDAEVLRQIKRRTLAKLRNEVAPVDARTLGRFLPSWQGVGSDRQGMDGVLETIVQLEGVPLSWNEWHQVILPSRVPQFQVDMLDMLAARGEIVWIGCGASGPKDGKVAIYLREHVGRCWAPPEDDADLPSAAHGAILEHLEARGASFLIDVQSALRATMPAVTDGEFNEAIWDLVWAGRITNDTFGPLRALGWKPRAVRGRGRRASPLAGGRWSLTNDFVGPDSATVRAVARAQQLLERYGIVSREVAQAEDIPGGFSAIYKVLREMEEAGKIRRGYFIEGLSAAQFARAGVVDRMRSHRLEEVADSADKVAANDVVFVPAADPANPYGALLPWPEAPQQAVKPRRIPGTWVVLVQGEAVLYVGSRGRSLVTLREPDDSLLAAALRELHRLPRGSRKGRLLIEKVDGSPIRHSPYAQVLLEAGFETTLRGLAASG